MPTSRSVARTNRSRPRSSLDARRACRRICVISARCSSVTAGSARRFSACAAMAMSGLFTSCATPANSSPAAANRPCPSARSRSTRVMSLKCSASRPSSSVWAASTCTVRSPSATRTSACSSVSRGRTTRRRTIRKESGINRTPIASHPSATREACVVAARSARWRSSKSDRARSPDAARLSPTRSWSESVARSCSRAAPRRPSSARAASSVRASPRRDIRSSVRAASTRITPGTLAKVTARLRVPPAAARVRMSRNARGSGAAGPSSTRRASVTARSSASSRCVRSSSW